MAYHRLARLLTAPAIPDDTRQVIWRLNSLVTRGERWFEAHAAVLLGITAERLSAAPGVPGAWQAAAWNVFRFPRRVARNILADHSRS